MVACQQLRMQAVPTDMELMVAGQHLLFLPEKALFWRETSVLLLADLHIGKSGHFRKHGIGLPSAALDTDIERLHQLIAQHRPKEVIMLGDLYHSAANKEWDIFSRFLHNWPDIAFQLVPGNHDRHFLKSSSPPMLLLREGRWRRPPFLFCHEPERPDAEGAVQICGHLHPGVTLRGEGRMRETLPCFWIQPGCIVLPAFGSLTGLFKISPAEGDRIVAIAGSSCMLF